MKWTRVTHTENIPVREGRCVNFGGEEVAIFNTGDRFLAIQNRCPHGNGPLADGIVAGGAVVCPLHGWKTCLESGEVQRPKDADICVRTFPVKVENGIVMIQYSSPTEEHFLVKERTCAA